MTDSPRHLTPPKGIDDCIERYGPIQPDINGGLLWLKAPDFLRPLPVPDEIYMTNIMGRRVVRIFANVDMHAALGLALQNTIAAGVAGEFETFDGCFNPRWVRGFAGVLSFHSWGLAVDFNAKKNPLGRPGTWSPTFIDCFKAAGFFWGGDFKARLDCQHFEWIAHDV